MLPSIPPVGDEPLSVAVFVSQLMSDAASAPGRTHGPAR
jgi:hypothetical protein